MTKRTKARPETESEPLDLGPVDKAGASIREARGEALRSLWLDERGDRKAGMRVLNECRLDAYLRRQSITENQHLAGLRFRRDWQMGASEQRVVANYLGTPSGADRWSDVKLAARQRYIHAMRAIGPAYSGVIVQVVCFDDEAPPSLARALASGLERLVRHYGMPVANTGYRRAPDRASKPLGVVKSGGSG